MFYVRSVVKNIGWYFTLRNKFCVNKYLYYIKIIEIKFIIMYMKLLSFDYLWINERLRIIHFVNFKDITMENTKLLS